jgi:hypothetical protein
MVSPVPKIEVRNYKTECWSLGVLESLRLIIICKPKTTGLANLSGQYHFKPVGRILIRVLGMPIETDKIVKGVLQISRYDRDGISKGNWTFFQLRVKPRG